MFSCARRPFCRPVSARGLLSSVGADDSVRPSSFRRGRRERRPLQREALSLRTSDRVTGVAIRIPARQRRAARPPLGGGCRRSRLGERKYRVISLPPSALRAATSLSEGGFGVRIPTPVCGLARNDRERDATPCEMTGGCVHITDGGDAFCFLVVFPAGLCYNIPSNHGGTGAFFLCA